MRPSISNAQLVTAILTASAPFAHALLPRAEIANSYDFVIVGGGQAGLVIGGRLSEDTNHTVLVLESGGNGDDYRDRIGMWLDRLVQFGASLIVRHRADTPAYSYFDSLWTTPLNWGFYTVAQPNANGREIYWPRGKVLGGSFVSAPHPREEIDTA